MSSADAASAVVSKQRKRRPDLDTLYSINEDGSRNFLHPADVAGPWQVRKTILWTVLLVVYFLLPWIEFKGVPVIHFDLPGRSAYLFGMTFTNQDFHLMFFALTGIGLSLFVATAFAGRLWCGFACPQTVFLEGIMRRVERWIEGPGPQRIKRSREPATIDSTWRKVVKHGLFLSVSLLIANTFLAYFLPARELVRAIIQGPAEHWPAFGWTMFWAGILYFNYAWFREQTCLIICPYGRLQSALIDEDTIVIGYDTARGEPRSKKQQDRGDCVDCFRCVAVCPTGIDIRNGLQMECVGCTNCIDACDEIMARLGRDKGLIRFDSQNGLLGGVRRSFHKRPRIWIYAVLGLIWFVLAGWTVSGREQFQANILRARGMPYVLEGARIRNLFTVRIQNKSKDSAVYTIAPEQTPQRELEFILPQQRIELGSMEYGELPVFVFCDNSDFQERFPLRLAVTDSISGTIKELTVTFRGPR